MPTIIEVANHAGVSKSTAWMVINNKDGVSPKTRQRVQESIRYLESIEAQATFASANGQSRSILIAHYELIASSEYFRELLQGVQTEVNKHGLQLIFTNVSLDVSQHHVTNLYFTDPDFRPDGVIVFGGAEMIHVRERAAPLNIPCVYVGINMLDYDVSFIAPNDVYAGYVATRHLLERGHRRIAYISSWTTPQFNVDRLQGYRNALTEAEITVDETLIQCGNYYPDGMDKTTTDIHKHIRNFQSQGVTACILADHIAVRIALPLFTELNITIPDALSVLGFDDTELNRHHEPPLTTVKLPLFKQGQKAVKTLLEILDDDELMTQQIFMRTTLIERESVRDLTKE
jgi:LacI family transcriptional regulator